MDTVQIVTLSLAALTCLLAVFAIVNEIRSNDIDIDNPVRSKRFARFGTYSAVVTGVLALVSFGISSLVSASARQNVANSGPAQPVSSPPLSTTATAPQVQQYQPGASSTGTLASAPISSEPAAPPPTFASDTASQSTYQPTSSGVTGYSWGAQTQVVRREDDDHDRHEAKERRPKRIPFPFTPVAYTVVLRFASDDPTIKGYVDRVLHQAERESGIPLTKSSDKFASLHILPGSEVVYADGKQAQLNRNANYVPTKQEAAAQRYLFDPQVHVTVSTENGARATFSKAVSWSSIKKEFATDLIDVYIFPKRNRVVLTVTANCAPLQGQFPDGAPSVFDLRGGTVAAQLVRLEDVSGPKLVDLDDVDRHGTDESMRLEASMAPRIHPTIVSILCATSPAGSVELGIDDSTIERSSVDRDAIEVCGPVMLNGFPAEPPAG